MNTSNLSPNDWQMLSEYMDGALNQRQAQQMEARLQAQPELRAGLEVLRRNRALLRRLPQRRVPHNFTLTRAQAAAIRPIPRGYPALRLVSALASFLLVIAFIGDLGFGLAQRSVLTTGANAAESAPAAAGAAPAQEGLLEPTQAADSEALPGIMAMPADDPTIDPTISAAMTAAPPGMGGGPLPTGTPELGALKAPPPEATPAPDEARQMPEQPELRAMGDETAEAAPMAEEPAAPNPAPDPRAVLRPLQVALAALALLAGLGAWWLRRQG